MVCLIRDIPVHYEEFGEGKPVFNIHGWGVDSRMMISCFEPVFGQKPGYRRIYPDLPGFGKTPPAKWVRTHDDTLDILREFIAAVIGRENFLLAGCSHGGYLSLGLIYKMRERIDGVFLLVTATTSGEEKNLPERQVLRQSEQLAATEDCPALQSYMSMAVVATPEIYEKWLTDIQPALDIEKFYDYSALASPDLDKAIETLTFDKPSCILAGRQDHSCGYASAYELAARFPRATFAALDCAGHIAQAENEPLFQALAKDWILRVEIGKH